MLLIHGRIYTMEEAEPIQDGFVQMDNGVIQAVGPMSAQPATEEETVDLHGANVYPGFIDAHTHLGMWEDGLTFEGDDGNEDTDPVTPQLRALDAINPMDRCFKEAFAAGVTTVVTGPGSANAIGGQMVALKTAGDCVDEMVVQEPVSMKMALGENPKTVYHGKSQAPSTRMATASLIREQLTKAQRYMQEYERAQNEEDFDEPEYDSKCEALLPVLRRELKVHFHAHRADDIYTAIRLGKEFNLDYVIIHGTEGYMIKEHLIKENVPVLSGPFLCDRSKPELRNLTTAASGIMAKAGVPVAIITDHPVIPIQYLPLCAGLAVREGMEYKDALRAITIEPAKICGLEARIGSIKAGKDADLAVFEQDPLSVQGKPTMVFVQGKRVL